MTKRDWIRDPLRRLQISFGALLLLLVALGYVSYRNVREIIAYTDIVRHTVEVQRTIEAIYADAAVGQSLERGYLLQPRLEYDLRYQEIRANARLEVTNLQALVADNPPQQKRAEQLRLGVSRLLLNTSFSAAQSHEEMMRGLQNAGPGGEEDLLRQIRDTRDRMIAEEDRLYALRTRARDQSIGQAATSFAFSALLTLSLLLGLYQRVMRHTTTIERARREAEGSRLELQRRVAEKERAENDLQRSNRELQEFAFVASHDLQEPLRKIRAFADRLRVRSEDRLDPTSLDYLARMDSAVIRMQSLIDALLNLSRVTTKGQPFERVSLNQAIGVVLDDLQERMDECGAIVTAAELPTIDADPIQIRQLFQNLIANSIKFRAPGRVPRIEITPIPSVDPTMVGICLRDNGIGFDPKHAERIFAVFQRLHGRSEYEGSGIGLAICRRIVDRHGGTIKATSAPREGATFTIFLPRQQSEIST